MAFGTKMVRNLHAAHRPSKTDKNTHWTLQRHTIATARCHTSRNGQAAGRDAVLWLAYHPGTRKQRSHPLQQARRQECRVAPRGVERIPKREPSPSHHGMTETAALSPAGARSHNVNCHHSDVTNLVPFIVLHDNWTGSEVQSGAIDRESFSTFSRNALQISTTHICETMGWFGIGGSSSAPAAEAEAVAQDSEALRNAKHEIEGLTSLYNR